MFYNLSASHKAWRSWLLVFSSWYTTLHQNRSDTKAKK